MKTVAIVQARMGSSRLPGKVLAEIAGRPMACLVLERVARAASVDQVVLATGDGAANDPLAATVSAAGFTVFRGSEDDVLERFHDAAGMSGADVVVRATADCPLIDPAVIDLVATARSEARLDYATNVMPPTWPDGLDVSVFTRRTLDAAHTEARLGSEREHVVPWMWKNSALERGNRLTAVNVPCDADLSHHRWTVDDPADLAFVRALFAAMGADSALVAGYRDVLTALNADPRLSDLNAGAARDEGLAISRQKDAADHG